MTPLAYQTPERAKCWCRRPPQGSMPSASSESCSPLRRSTPGRGDPERRKLTRPGAVGNHKADPLVSDLHTLDRSSNELTDLLRPKSFFRPTERRGFGLVVDRLANIYPAVVAIATLCPSALERHKSLLTVKQRWVKGLDLGGRRVWLAECGGRYGPRANSRVVGRS